MTVNTKNLVSITEANQNFSRVARMADENGTVVILKNNAPRYLLIDFNEVEKEQIANDEDVLLVSKRFLASVLNTNPLSNKESLSYKDLEDQNLIVIGPEFRTNIEQWLDQLFRSNDCNPPKIIRKIEDPIGLQTALQSDDEAVVSSGFVRKLTSPVIKTYNLPNATCSMYAVWKRGNIHPKLHEAIEEIRQFCNKSAPV